MVSSSNSSPSMPLKVDERKFLGELVNILRQVNRGVRLEEILDNVFESFGGLLPYDRIGFSLIDPKAYTATAFWARCRYAEPKIKKGYSASIKGSSLERVLLTGQPRIIVDLEQYAREHPDSQSSRLMLEEGVRSSLTCPLTRGDNAIGFIFFSSQKTNTYKYEHVEVFRWLAEPLSLALDKAQIYERLVGLNEEKNLFLGVAAHDLRSPIAQLQTIGELLAVDELADKDRKEMASLIVARCQSMLSLLHDMLDLSAIEAGRLPLKPEKLRLETFCQSLLKGIGPLAKAKQIKLKFEGATTLEAVADPARLAQVLDNLLTNAIKYSPPKSLVTLSINELPKGWEMVVADQGPGIAANDLPHLFKPFGKTPNLPTAGEAQFGLGLAIVKKIVEAHGGEIGVESTPGKGSAFRIRLPKLAN